MMEKPNVLILDEPTNHLDLDSKEVLENALIDYPGTILFVSHDRYFINRIATKVIELATEGSTEFLGDYDYYVEKKLEQAEIQALEATAAIQLEQDTGTEEKTSYQMSKEAKKLERQRVRRIEEIETTIEELESKVSEHEALLCEPEVFQDHEKVLELNKNLEQLKDQMERLMDEWTELSDK